MRRKLQAMTLAERQALFASLPDPVVRTLAYDWGLLARDKQLAPVGDWLLWLILAGRGFGKTRTGAEWVRGVTEEDTPEASTARIALIGPTASDTRDVMIEGESGILAISPPWNRPNYEPSKRRIVWKNGATATSYSAEEPERLRGPQHTHAWADEIATWKYPDAWDQLLFGLRLGKRPRAVATTTPRPTPLIRKLLADATTKSTRGSTKENASNLARSFIENIYKKYEGTRLGRQELDAEVLDDTPGALWKRGQLDALQVRELPLMKRIAIAIDPAVSSKATSAETGIIVGGVGEDDHAYIIEDLSGRFTPNEWARIVVNAYNVQQADRVVAESNQGGDLVEVNVRTVAPFIAYRAVHASRGKRTRAEPVSALYEQGRVHHMVGLATLEDQMCTWDPTTDTESPDRVDALVWLIFDLMLTEAPSNATDVLNDGESGGRSRYADDAEDEDEGSRARRL